MTQRIILIHGRSTKPAEDKHADLLKRALLQGLHRADPQKARKVESGEIPIDFVYYGDINNEILAEKSNKIRATLTDSDPDHDGAHCLSDAGYADAIDAMTQFKYFTKREYEGVLARTDNMSWRDNLARWGSTLSAITTATLLNETVIKRATADLGAYLMRRTVGSRVRERLQWPLRKALMDGDDICLVAHSMGCMVTYDVLWKFSRMSEYRRIQERNNPISLWLTLGSPLGEAGVKANLYDADERVHENTTDKHPKNIIKEWHNFAARDDFICHDATMADDFSDMRKFDFIQHIADHNVYNCWSFDGVSNPHKFYGYLANHKVVHLITDWIK